jgi:hypothetical protein
MLVYQRVIKNHQDISRRSKTMVPLKTVWKGSQVGNTDLEGAGQKHMPWVLDVNPPTETVFLLGLNRDGPMMIKLNIASCPVICPMYLLYFTVIFQTKTICVYSTCCTVYFILFYSYFCVNMYWLCYAVLCLWQKASTSHCRSVDRRRGRLGPLMCFVFVGPRDCFRPRWPSIPCQSIPGP